MNVEGLGVVITGASRGLGAELSRELAKRGARVLLVARGAEDLGRVAAEIRAGGGAAYEYAADVADKRASFAIAGVAAELVGPVELLVHNASILGPTPLAPLLDTDCEALEAVLAANVVGPFRLTKAIAGHMAVRSRGLVVSVSSDAAVSAYRNWGAYGVSKAALDHLSRVFAAELERSGVRFWSVDPGEMNTKMHEDALPDADPHTLRDPRAVAVALADTIARAESIPSGSRFELWGGTAP